MFLGRKNQYCENDYTTNAIYRFNAIPIKLSTAFFKELEQKISQFMWKHKRLWIPKAVLRKKEWNWRNQPSWLQIILESYSHQDSMILAQKQKYRPMKQDRKSKDKLTHTCRHLIFDKRDNNMQWRKDSLFNRWCWENRTAIKEWN